jgi:pantetheine-phosphate adenylyltransferase
MVKAIYPGTFDPVHNGHVDVAERASKLFDDLLLGVYESPPKSVMFTTQERVSLFQESVAHVSNVRVESFGGLAVDFARNVGAQFIVRGLRAGFDFESEFEMALMWRNLAPDIDVVCMMSALEYQFVYSSRIKEVAQLGGNISGLVPKCVADALKAKLSQPA